MTRSTNIGLGIDWTFSNLEGLINNRGETVIHEIGLKCTCGLEDTYAGQMERTHIPRTRKIYRCDICGGSGNIYRNPKRIIAIITDIRENISREESGWLVPGDCIMSVKPGYKVSSSDLITFTWSQPLPEGQVILRGAGTTSDNSSRKTNLEENEDRLWYSADSAIWCEDEDGVVYHGGSDFVLDGSKIIKWQGRAPIKNKRYVVKYNAFLEWEAFAPPNVRRDRDRSLGDRVLLRKLHIARVNEDPTITQRDRVTFCTRTESC